jgi:hypothetical protein
MSDQAPRLDANGFVVLDEDSLDWANPEAIAACGICDDDGYRGHLVCDHVDHAAAASAGMAKVREALAKRGNR